MELLHLCLLLKIGIVFAKNENAGKQNVTKSTDVSNLVEKHHKSLPPLPGLHQEKNVTYDRTYDREENLVVIPSNLYDSVPRKNSMKQPKRTIQKIIRKGKSKTKRVLIVRTPKTTTQEPEVSIIEYSLEEVTTEARRKPVKNKKPIKNVRNQRPFHKMQARKRNKRAVVPSRELFIIQDFDEMEFLPSATDRSVVRTHMKKYW